MNRPVEIIQVETSKDLVAKYLECPSKEMIVGFAKDIKKHLLCIRYLDDMRGFAGLSVIEKGQFEVERFQVFDQTAIDNKVDEDLYVMYVLEGSEVQFLTLSDIFSYEEETEFGIRYKLNCKDQTLSYEVMEIEDVKINIKKSISPRSVDLQVSLI